MKTLLRAVGIAFAVAALVILTQPVFSTYVIDVESCDMVVRGYNMAEFSVWGGMVPLFPLMIVGLMLSKLDNGVKTVGLLAIFLLCGASLCGACISAHNWISEAATGRVTIYSNQMIYALFIFISSVFFWVECNVPWMNIGIRSYFENIIEEDS